MNRLVLVIVAILALHSTYVTESADPAATCDVNACQIGSNCRCSNAPSPLDGDLADWPQLISIAFNDAITQRVYSEILQPFLFDRKNPDDKPIGATLFVPHEYTDYTRVNDLYNLGFEIGVNSITNNPDQNYWRLASTDTLTQEFQGQKQILQTFAQIPEGKIVGVRTPQLQINANNTINAYIAGSLTYDSSWPSLPSRRLFPYTLDYQSNQQCLLGAACPNEPFQGFWVLPINDLTADTGTGCNTIAACKRNGSADDIANWLISEIEAVRNSTKVPMTLNFNADWFNGTESSAAAFDKFMTDMSNKKDVFFVTQSQVLNWIKNPVKLADFQTDDAGDPANCTPNECKLKKGNQDRNFNICTSCPQTYPWIGNPSGN